MLTSSIGSSHYQPRAKSFIPGELECQCCLTCDKVMLYIPSPEFIMKKLLQSLAGTGADVGPGIPAAECLGVGFRGGRRRRPGWLQSPGLGGAARVAVALLPIPPGLLYGHSPWRWIHGLDELQRRTQWGGGRRGLRWGCCWSRWGRTLLRGAGFGPGLNFGWEGISSRRFVLCRRNPGGPPARPMKNRLRNYAPRRKWSQGGSRRETGSLPARPSTPSRLKSTTPVFLSAFKIARLFRESIESVFSEDGAAPKGRG